MVLEKMRGILEYNLNKRIPSSEEREWNYLFLINERVRLIPWVDIYWLLNPLKYSDSDINTIKNSNGIVINQYVDICCSMGCSYITVVSFNGLVLSLSSYCLYSVESVLRKRKR